APNTGRAGGELRAGLLRIDEELLPRLRWQRVGYGEEEPAVTYEIRHRDEVLLRVVRQALVHRRVDDEARGIDEQRVAVGRRLRHDLRADDAVRAGLVLDDEGLAELLLELRADHARYGVRTTGRRGDHHAHRLARIALRLRSGRRHACEGKCKPPAHSCLLRSSSRYGAGAPLGMMPLGF